MQLFVQVATPTAVKLTLVPLGATEDESRQLAGATQPAAGTQSATETLTETLTEIELRLTSMPFDGTDNTPATVQPTDRGESDMPDWLSCAWDVHQAEQEL